MNGADALLRNTLDVPLIFGKRNEYLVGWREKDTHKYFYSDEGVYGLVLIGYVRVIHMLVIRMLKTNIITHIHNSSNVYLHLVQYCPYLYGIYRYKQLTNINISEPTSFISSSFVPSIVVAVRERAER